MKHTIYYQGHLPVSAGGQLVNFQHVATLRKLGWRAMVLLGEGSKIAQASRPYVVPMVEAGANMRLSSHDVVVLPEISPPQQWAHFKQQGCRVVMHNQNPYYTFQSFTSMRALSEFGLFGAMCPSAFTAETLQRWGCTLDWQVVRPFVLPVFAQTTAQLAAQGLARRRQIAYMPRKRPVEAILLRGIFANLYPQWADVPWVEISGMQRGQVAQVLAQSQVFASLSQHESLGLPPLEAMAAGCLVAGFTGQGGAEYATSENGRWVAEGDLEAFAHALALDLQATPEATAARHAAAAATVARFDVTQFEWRWTPLGGIGWATRRCTTVCPPPTRRCPMRLNHMTQVDVPGGRFWMDLCAGRDQVAMQVHRSGWMSYEAPLPALLAAWCQALSPLVVDVGANTGYYSLLAAVSGAREVLAVEPVQEIAQVLAGNVALSELDGVVQLCVEALGEAEGLQTLHFPLADHGLLETSASLNPAFRAQHSQQRQVPVRTLDALLASRWPLAETVPLLIKMDVETAELAVLGGATRVLTEWRPALVAEMLPGIDTAAWAAFMARFDYVHHGLQDTAPQVLPASAEMALSLTLRDHVFLPREQAQRWLQPFTVA